ncbi:hypothetical protein BOTBODRAFT_103051 [Botryobasidium botryosum FD-172 SS1]|uniref:Xylulose kinase n=1 Tax=Botryobasidium botryosum (strain FD-172 SS1) TaxID=930990 RepID=A0A067MWB1_BOTB1|nr:hypothetical protein BOTBODRAFT_103051 [Botryobasidium botryosum FD-172 SS1]
MSPPLFLGLDLSTQQLKAIIIDEAENIVFEGSIHFDKDLPHHGTVNGAVPGPDEAEMTCPVAVWLESLDLLMERLKDADVDLGSIVAVSGAAQQHGSVYWNADALNHLSSLDPAEPLLHQLTPALSLENAPIWQDSSTTAECRALEEAVGGAQRLSDITGSRAYERFTASQISKIYRKKTEVWADTRYVSLVSSFLASLFLGHIAPIEVSDASGMNLMSIKTCEWDDELLKVSGGEELKAKLDGQPVPGGTNLGKIGSWWVERFGFNKDCIVAPFTGDNPSSIVSLSSPGDAILSLGTSTTFLVSIPPSSTLPKSTTTSHLLSHPTTPGGFIAMLCYKNGSLTRENVRDRFASGDWDAFNRTLTSTPAGNNGYMGFYFPLREIIPDGVIGEHFFRDGEQIPEESFPAASHPRAVLESQLLSIRSRILSILPPSSTHLRRCVVTGGSSANTTFLQVIANILDLPVYVASTSGSATVGGALLGKFAWWRAKGNQGTFEDMRPEGAKTTNVAVPDPEEAKMYEGLVDVYRRCEDKISGSAN